MAPTPSIKVTKSFLYKGGTRQWSNRYHFNGGTPANSGAWTTFSDLVVAAEKLCQFPTTTVVSTTGYAAGSDLPVFTKAYSVACTEAGTPPAYIPGDGAILLRWATAARSSKNHAIYLFNYFHGCALQGTGVDAQVNSTQKGLIQTYMASWISGFSDGTNSYVRAGPNGATATGSLVANYPTHRDFPK